MRYCAVRPFRTSAAAVSSSMASGSFTSRQAGITVACEYARGRSEAYATRSPGFTSVTPSPTASTTPAASMPITCGSCASA